MENCIFCKISKGEIPASVIYQDENVMAFMDINAINHGHLLVMPRSCYATLKEMPEDLAAKVLAVVVKIERAVWSIPELNCEGTNILQNNGSAAWQEVDHVHFHIIPRQHTDGFRLQFEAKKPNRERLEQLANLIRTSL